MFPLCLRLQWITLCLQSRFDFASPIKRISTIILIVFRRRGREQGLYSKPRGNVPLASLCFHGNAKQRQQNARVVTSCSNDQKYLMWMRARAEDSSWELFIFFSRAEFIFGPSPLQFLFQKRPWYFARYFARCVPRLQEMIPRQAKPHPFSVPPASRPIKICDAICGRRLLLPTFNFSRRRSFVRSSEGGMYFRGKALKRMPRGFEV